MTHKSGLFWFGGKARPELHKWIISLLPDSYDLYVEPYAGMLGVLLNRNKAAIEIVNDLNGNVVNWWRVIRDKKDEFKEQLLWTPNSEELFYEYYDSLSEGTDVERAIKLTVVQIHSRMSSDNRRAFGNRMAKGASKNYNYILEQLDELRKRTRNVIIRKTDALSLLKKMVNRDYAVTYCDPPYKTADTSLYSVDVQQDLTEVLLEQKGKVAISGYNDEWDHLGWFRHTKEIPYANGMLNEKQPMRTEVLWTNYKGGSQLTLGDNNE